MTGGASYSKEFEDSLFKLLEDGEKFIVLSQYNCTLGSYLIWIANYPYASFNSIVEYAVSGDRIIHRSVRPSRRGIAKLKAAFVEQEPALSFLFE